MKLLKLHIIKFFAVVMSVMYLFTLLSKEIVCVLHNISHHLERPGVILTHNNELNIEANHKISSRYSHEHKIIDFIDYIFSDEIDKNKSNKSTTFDVKIDKHFCSLDCDFLKSVFPSVSSNPSFYIENGRNTFLKKINVPPKISSLQLC